MLKYTFMHHITKLTLLELYTITSFSELEQKPQRPFLASTVKTIFSQTHINLPLLSLTYLPLNLGKIYWFYISQDYRIIQWFEVRRDLKDHLYPNSLTGKGTPSITPGYSKTLQSYLPLNSVVLSHQQAVFSNYCSP